MVNRIGYKNSLVWGKYISFLCCFQMVIIGRIPFGPINDIEHTFQHPQAIARKMITDIQASVFES